MWFRACAAVVLAACLICVPGHETASAQTPSRPEPPAALILTVNPERLFQASEFGRRTQRQLEDAARRLAAENREIEAELTAEERALTEERTRLSMEAFRDLADQFDARVDQIRAEQDEKSRELQRLRDLERQRFSGLIGEALADLMRARGAVVLLDARNVVISAEAIDITEEAVALINETVGDGADGAPSLE